MFRLHIDALNKAANELFSSSLHLDGESREGTIAAVLGLYGLRVLAASSAYFQPLNLTSDLRDAWSRLKREVKDVGSALNKEFDALSKASGITALSHHPDYTSYREERLTRAILTLDTLSANDFSSLHVRAIGSIADLFANQPMRNLKVNRTGVHTTQWPLNLLTARLLTPRPTGTAVRSVYDPTCGMGGSLIAVHEQLSASGRSDNVRYYGQDVSERVVFVAAWNLLFHGIMNIDLRVGDTLRAPRFLDGNKVRRFDLVIAQPPFHYAAEDDFGPNDPYGRFRYGGVLSSRADYAFVQHVVASLAPEGRAAVVMALTALSRSGFEEEIRAHIVHAGILEAVVGFQGNILLGKNVPAALLLFELANPSVEPISVYFYDAPVDKLNSTENTPEQFKNQLRSFVNMYWTVRERTGISTRVIVERMKAQQYSLAPQAYILQQRPEKVDAVALDKEIGAVEQQVHRAEKEFKDALERLRAGRHG